jgi:hypothetical protein
MLLKPVIAEWPDVIKPEKGRPFRKYAAVALVEHVLVDHVNFRTSVGDILFPNKLGLPGLAPYAPTLEELGQPVGMNRHAVAVVLDWLVSQGVLDKTNHGRLRATVWSFRPLMNGTPRANHDDQEQNR